MPNSGKVKVFVIFTQCILQDSTIRDSSYTKLYFHLINHIKHNNNNTRNRWLFEAIVTIDNLIVYHQNNYHF